MTSGVREPDSNVVAVDFRRRRVSAYVSERAEQPRVASVYSKITDHDEIEYGMIDVDARAAPRLMRGLLALLSELMDVASI